MESNRFWWFLMSTLSVVNDSSHSYLTAQKMIRKHELKAKSLKFASLKLFKYFQ